jgi:hypothetical protein
MHLEVKHFSQHTNGETRSKTIPNKEIVAIVVESIKKNFLLIEHK